MPEPYGLGERKGHRMFCKPRAWAWPGSRSAIRRRDLSLTAIPRGVHVDASGRFRWLVLLVLALAAWVVPAGIAQAQGTVSQFEFQQPLPDSTALPEWTVRGRNRGGALHVHRQAAADGQQVGHSGAEDHLLRRWPADRHGVHPRALTRHVPRCQRQRGTGPWRDHRICRPVLLHLPLDSDAGAVGPLGPDGAPNTSLGACPPTLLPRYCPAGNPGFPNIPYGEPALARTTPGGDRLIVASIVSQRTDRTYLELACAGRRSKFTVARKSQEGINETSRFAGTGSGGNGWRHDGV